MSVPGGDLKHIVDYLMRKDPQDQSAMALGDNIFSDEWPSNSDELLDNFFSMDGALLDLPSSGVDDLNPLVFPDQGIEPAHSLAGSDSGLSMDHADLDLIDQQLSPLMMHQPSSDDDILHSSFVNQMHQVSSPNQIASPPSSHSSSSSDIGSPINIYEDKTEAIVCQNTTKDFKQPVQAFQNVINLKRKSSVSPPAAVVLPKLSKNNIITKRELITGKNISTNNKQKIILSNSPNSSNRPVSSNVQIVNNQPLTVQSADVSSTQKKIIRVAPVQGNTRSILLPVTIKDMKDLRSIKIINATDLKNPANIKLAAANFLQKSKQAALELKKKSGVVYAAFDDEQQYMMEDSTSDRGSGHSDDDDDDRMGDDDIPVTRNKNGQFPRLELTNEEKRLLVKEGISLPSCYPLTRLEERELKRIRRKIRNKISAQDSRRRKKEYVDGLEDRVKQCTDENQSLLRKIKALQSQNQSLASQLKKLRNIVTKSSGGYKSAQPATCLMVLLLSVALVMAPSLRTGNNPSQSHKSSSPGYTPHSALLNSIRRALLSAQTTVPAVNVGVNSMEESVEDIVNVDEVLPFGQPLSDHNYPLMECPVPNKGGRFTTPRYMDIPLDDGGSPPKSPMSPALKNYPVKLEQLEYDFEYDGDDFLLSHLEEVDDNAIEDNDIKDESIKLYDVAMEKLEILDNTKSGFVQISDNLDKLLEYTPQTVQIDPDNFNNGNKKNFTKVRNAIMTNMELQ